MKVIITNLPFRYSNVILVIKQPLPCFIKSGEFSSIEDRYRLPRSQSLYITPIAQADAGNVLGRTLELVTGHGNYFIYILGSDKSHVPFQIFFVKNPRL